MPAWSPDTLSERVPLYVALADALAKDIRSGRLKAGERLPTHRSLADIMGVNVMTVTRGYREAARRGLVVGEVGRGTFVSAVDKVTGPRSPEPTEGARAVDFNFNLPWSGTDIADPTPWLRAAAEDPRALHLDRGYDALGLSEHRKAGAILAGQLGGDQPDHERVVVTMGVQHAMSLCLGILCSPGDGFLVEELTYPGLHALASFQHLHPVVVTLDDDGIDPEALRAAARRSEARVLYCMPTAQNPTGSVSTLKRRKAIVEVAREFDLWILEDDSYAYAADPHPEPLSALAPERTFRLIGTAKGLSAGLRIGYLVVPDRGDWIDRLATTVSATTWMAAPALADLAAHWIQNGTAERVAVWKRREAAARRELCARTLSLEAQSVQPGVPHVWFQLPQPWTSERFARAARSAGVLVSPSQAFTPGRGEAPNAVRLSLGTPPSREEVARGLSILQRVLTRGWERLV
jgi:DNA-binding transcriptional MocR family regulator